MRRSRSFPQLLPVTLTALVSLAAGCNRPREAPRSTALATGPADARTSAPATTAAHDPTRTASRDLVLRGTFLSHPTAYVPAQCYTRTRDAEGKIHNPCYACHQASMAPNYVDDGDVQLSYAFPEPALENPWANLFVDRRAVVAAQSDEEILHYVREDNYHDARGEPMLAAVLASPPHGWDVDEDGRWSGYVPDAALRFDERGFDRRADGSYSGWRAFAYYPFLGTFFPTNGSTDDVMIRLPEVFRNKDDGTFDAEVYTINLAIVEALVRREAVTIPETDERAWGVDLDANGRLGEARRVAFVWEPARARTMHFVGAARRAQEEGALLPLPGLFPLGTEFLHSVRYVDVSEDGDALLSPRMKELRYAKKTAYPSYGTLEQAALREAREDRATPDRTHEFVGDPEHGVRTGLGWVYQGFIEDREGRLRPQTFEEHTACVGCHSGIGATTDGIFSFPRKLDGSAFQAGWFHPTQRSLRGVPDPRRADGRPEYATYLRENGAGDELRGNAEVQGRFFDREGNENRAAFSALARDVSVLLFPSRERALTMAKAYRTIVLAQSYRDGRDAPLDPATEVHRSVEPEAPTGVAEPVAGTGLLRR